MGKKKAKGSLCKGCPQYMSNKDVQQKMLLQLHEQYAVNNNSSLSSVVSLIVGMFAAIGFYGYAFVFSTNEFETSVCDTCSDSCSFSLTQLSIIAIISLLILAIIIHICIYQGSAQRLEQFIIHQIRMKYGIVCQNGMSKILPYSYKPSGKRGLKIVQGLYGEIVKISAALELLIIVSLLVKYILNIVQFYSCQVSIEGVVVLIVVLLWFVYLASRNLYFLHKRENLYLKREREYQKKVSSNISQSIKNTTNEKIFFWSKRTIKQAVKIFSLLFCWKNLDKKLK